MTHEELGHGDDVEGLLRYLAGLKRAGDHTQIERAVALLEHAHPEVRAEAISTVLTHGRLVVHRQVALQALLKDSAEEVRGAAAHALAAVSSAETQHEDVAALLKVLSDIDETDEVRRDAYVALQLVHRRTDFPAAAAQFVPEADIDWDWVREVGMLHGIDVRKGV